MFIGTKLKIDCLLINYCYVIITLLFLDLITKLLIKCHTFGVTFWIEVDMFLINFCCFVIYVWVNLLPIVSLLLFFFEFVVFFSYSWI